MASSFKLLDSSGEVSFGEPVGTFTRTNQNGAPCTNQNGAVVPNITFSPSALEQTTFKNATTLSDFTIQASTHILYTTKHLDMSRMKDAWLQTRAPLRISLKTLLVSLFMLALVTGNGPDNDDKDGNTTVITNT